MNISKKSKSNIKLAFLYLIFLCPLLIAFCKNLTFKNLNFKNPKPSDLEEMEELYNSLGNNQIIFDSQFIVGVDLRTYIRAENFQGFKKEKSIIYQNVGELYDVLDNSDKTQKLNWIESCRYQSCNRETIKIYNAKVKFQDGVKTIYQYKEIACKSVEKSNIVNFKIYDCNY